MQKIHEQLSKVMSSKLESSFFKYLSLVVAAFDRKKQDDSHAPKTRLPRIPLVGVDYSRRERWENERLFLKSEQSDEFNQLVADTRPFFSDEGPAFQRLWEVAVKNFLRRSGVYLEIFDGKEINMSAVFSDYCTAFKRQQNQEEYQRHYLALIEHVAFHDFGAREK